MTETTHEWRDWLRTWSDKIDDEIARYTLLEALNDADKCARLEQHVITRSEIEAMGYEVPGWADRWERFRNGQCVWDANDAKAPELAPDIRPDTDGPMTLQIVDC
jgi:hypothetical protein